MINPTTGESVSKEQYSEWLKSREAAHVEHLLAIEEKKFSESFEQSFNEVFNNE